MNDVFEGFSYPATHLRKFVVASSIFTLSLADGTIIHYIPTDKAAFLAWLEFHGVENLRPAVARV